MTRVLIVGDEDTVRTTVAALRDLREFVTVAAGSVEAALHCLQTDPTITLVLADVLMPGSDGLALLDRIVVDYPSIPVVMFSAAHDIYVATSAFRRGAVDYLLKPFELAQLTSVLLRAAEHGRLRAQNYTYQQNLEQTVSARTRKLRTAMQDLERSYDITLEAMGDALDLRDAETEGHSRRVTAYTTALAREMGLNAEDLRVIARGAFLHDIGKIATPDRVLLKPGKLDELEMELMREHCQRGYDMVSKIPFLRAASEIVYAHQESFDGTGYPRGLAGTAIPLGARIFAIADTLDAITSDRPYRRGRSFSEAREEIRRCAGKQFDPAIVEVFLNIPPLLWSELRAEILRMAPSMVSSTLCRPDEAASGSTVRYN